ncbi:DUF3159 domain-containing protein [Georgenia halophila]|uniref:DUF3159 domain-containing protein n=1 Tax=Georgenia halophila TaxID=620889 RepID=A0ABP8LQ64_9MICO
MSGPHADEPQADEEGTGGQQRDQPDLRQAAAGAAQSSAFRQLAGEDFSVLGAVGGVRGLIESVAPGLVFVVVYILTREITPPLVASLAVAVLAVVSRLIARTPVTQALGGVVGVVIGVVWAWQSGEVKNFFALGLWTNAIYAVALTISVLARWPVVGLVVSLLKGQDFSWRTDPEQRSRRSRYVLATWLWVGLFVLRLAVKLPLFLQAETPADNTWLGTAHLLMGLPLWGLTLWLTWALVRERASAEAR